MLSARVLGAVLALGLVQAVSGQALAQGANAYPCQIFPSAKAEVASPVAGVLAEVLVDRGAHVVKGQPLARLRAEMEEAQVALAQARAGADAQLRARRAKLSQADRVLGRNRDLLEKKFISENEVDQMRTERDVAQQDVSSAAEALGVARLELEQAKVALSMRTIRSPIDGVVTERALSAGEQVREKPIMVIQQVDSLHAEVALPASLVRMVKIGTKARISFPVAGVDAVSASIAVLDPVIDPSSDTFTVRFVIDNKAGLIPGGIKCHADIVGAP